MQVRDVQLTVAAAVKHCQACLILSTLPHDQAFSAHGIPRNY